MTGTGAAFDALAAEGFRFVVPIEPAPDHFDAQGHLNNAAVAAIFNDMRVAYVRAGLGDRWGDYLRERGLVVVAREVHLLYESEGLPGEEYVGAMRYLRREGRGAVIEQRLVEAAAARPVARAWVGQLLVSGGAVADWPDFYFEVVAGVEGRAIETRPSVRRPWGPGE